MTELPKVLYHYTTAQGLLGILESHRLWATNLHFMNDFSELKYAGNLMDSMLQAAIQEDALEERISHSSFSDIWDLFSAYAVCFCEEGDQLSQWRNYSEKGTGYALGFDARKLNEILQPRQVEYVRENQIRAIKPAIENYVEQIKGYLRLGSGEVGKDIEQKKLAEIAFDFYKKVFGYFFCFKHSAFSEEREWRMISVTPINDHIKDLHFRETQGTVVPFIEIGLPSSESIILEIVQGPRVDPELGKKSLELLLEKCGYKDVTVKLSNVPIRF